MLRGDEVEVKSSDKHLVHAREHVAPLVEGMQAVKEGQLTYEEMASKMYLLWVHAAEHVALIEGDPATEQEAAILRQILQQAGEIIENGIKQIEANGPPEGTEEGQVDPEMLKEMERHQQKLRHKEEEAELDRAIKIRAAETAEAIEDAKAAAGISRKRKTETVQ